MSSELVPCDRQYDCVCYDERAPRDDGYFPCRSAPNTLLPTRNAYTCGMRQCISEVVLLKGPPHFHSSRTNCAISESFPTPEWDPHWLQRIDLKLNVLCGRLSQFHAVAFRTHHIYADWNQSERKNKHGNDDASTDGISPET